MAIKINWQDLLKRFINWQEIVRVYKNGGQIRPETVPPVFDDYLCFTAEQSNSSITLNASGYSINNVTQEISYDKTNWEDYVYWTAITLTNVWDKVYMRNKSETPTSFNYWGNYYRTYYFSMNWLIGASGDANYLLCKYSTTTLSGSFYRLFSGCSWLTSAPRLPATTLTDRAYEAMFQNCVLLTTPPQLPATTLALKGYYQMFEWCTRLATVPQLPATTLADRCYEEMFMGCTSLTTAMPLPATTIAAYCYYNMFNGCTSLRTLISLPATWNLPMVCYSNMFAGCSYIKVSTTQEWEYQTPYRIPSSWEWTEYQYYYCTDSMFRGTWWTFATTPSLNTTYYTSNQVI